jgi:hypothetical protein
MEGGHKMKKKDEIEINEAYDMLAQNDNAGGK